VLAAAAETVGPALAAKSIRFETAFDPDVPPVVGDPDRLQQVVWNLLSNAIKFTPEGGSVRLALRRAGAQAAIEVRDSGDGIPPDFLPHVFERFRQADTGSRRRYGGLGLGLAIVRHLVELHGGTISATSEGPGHGAAFTVTLPTASEVVLEVPPLGRTTAVSARPLHGIRVLAVEDHEDSRELIRMALAERGAETVVASSVDEALAVLGREPIDVLVSDVGMPHRDGYALVEALRELERARGRRQIPAIALTAFAGRDDRDRLLAAGFQVHIAKPIDPDVLADTVARTLAR
jgi:CheY-like chemotaxis protein